MKKIIERIGTGKLNAFVVVSLIAMLTFSFLPMFTLAQSGSTQTRETAGYIVVSPNVIGVGQQATVNLWVFPMPQNYMQSAYFRGYQGVTVTFLKPDGSKDTFLPQDGMGTLAPGVTESIGSIFFYYEPDMAGNWSASFTMPAQNITDSTGTVFIEACTSMTAYFTVQTEPVLAGLLNGYPWGELPDEDVYWDYPINSNNRDWSAISGDWLQGNVGTPPGSFHGVTSRLWQPYGVAPNTGHIVWDIETAAGGIIGGDYGSLSYAQTAFNLIDGAVIMEGKVFSNIATTRPMISGTRFQCNDLATGELLYTATGQITCGLHLPGNSMVQNRLVDGENNNVVLESSHGSDYTPYLFGTSGTSWNYYDPFTGELMRTISNCSSATIIDGTNLAYGASSSGLIAWNLTRVVNNNWPTGIMWNKTIGAVNRLVGLSADLSTIVTRGVVDGKYVFSGFSTNGGTSLWNTTIPFIVGQAFSLYGPSSFVVFNSVDATFHCYSMETGIEKWTSPSFADSPWTTQFTVYTSYTSDNDNFYAMFADGTINAMSLETGELVWQSSPIPSTEYVYNTVPYWSGLIKMGGNIYAYAGYSIGYQLNPIPRFAMLVCVNATNGDTTFTLNSGGYPVAAANGYVITLGTYDGKNYCIGKGQTSTAVTIQNNVIANHATALITGNVLDQSPAQAGTQAVADSSMSEWMDYLHMQNTTLLNNPPKPEGVSVTITAVDPNGNTITIGTTSTDSEGNFAINFAPENVGMYTIQASFAGTNAYYSSHSEAHLSVLAASEATPTSTPIANPPYELYTIGSAVAVIIAIAVAVLLLRKKP